MHRIMFVCHGNICRSPMAEFVFKDIVKKAGKEDEYHIASSATSTEEIYMGRGNPVYPPAKRELALHGLSSDGKTAVQLKKSDYDKYDMFIGMDTENIYNMERIFGGDSEGKIYKMLDFAGGGDVSDPWYSGDFRRAYEDIEKGCKALFIKTEGNEEL